MKVTPFGCFVGLLFAFCVGLAGRNDMLRDEQAIADEVVAAPVEMVQRAVEQQCGGEAIQTGRGLRCARDINPALVANAGVTR